MTACTAVTCLDAASAAFVFSIPMTMYATGFGIGKLVALVQKMYDAA